MEIRKRARITQESHEVLIVRRRRRRTAWCEECQREVDWLAVDDAAQVASATSRSIYRRVEAGTLHSSETPDGRLWICVPCLPQASPTRRLEQEQ